MLYGRLPHTIKCDGKEYELRTDYWIALRCLIAFQDNTIPEWAKSEIMLKLLVIDYDSIEDTETAIDECIKFLDCGKESKNKHIGPKVFDWEQDEQMIFSAVNKVAGKEVREEEHLHWWTFIGYFNEIGEGTFNTVVGIRVKRKKHKKLEKYEEEFYRDNRDLVDIKRKISDEEREKIKRINAMYQ